MNTHRLLKITLAFLLVSFLLCAEEPKKPQLDWNSGDDASRLTAKMLPINVVITDSLDAIRGNHTNWRYLSVPQKGVLKISTYWDNPFIPASVTLTDELGQEIIVKLNAPNAQKQNITVDVPAKSKYYLKYFSLKSRSTYSIKAEFFPYIPPKPVVIPIPKPKPVFVYIPQPIKKPEPKKEEKPKPPVPKFKIISANIVLVIQDTSGSKFTINKGSVDKIKAGHTGTIIGIENGAFQIIQVYPTRSLAFTKAKNIQTDAVVNISVRIDE